MGDDFAALLKSPARLSEQDRIVTEETKRRVFAEVTDLFEGNGMGSKLPGSRGTAWGAYNAVTEYLTHHRGRSDENRANNLWFGSIGDRAIQAAQSTFLSA